MFFFYLKFSFVCARLHSHELNLHTFVSSIVIPLDFCYFYQKFFFFVLILSYLCAIPFLICQMHTTPLSFFLFFVVLLTCHTPQPSSFFEGFEVKVNWRHRTSKKGNSWPRESNLEEATCMQHRQKITLREVYTVHNYNFL